MERPSKPAVTAACSGAPTAREQLSQIGGSNVPSGSLMQKKSASVSASPRWIAAP
jgi:hypothetical protein